MSYWPSLGYGRFGPRVHMKGAPRFDRPDQFDPPSSYDADRFWLTRLLTARASASSHGAATLQDLGYACDLVGNITGLTDDAQETVFFANAEVSPDRTFTYDSLYRLVTATGREKVSQTQSTAWYANYAGAMGAVCATTTRSEHQRQLKLRSPDPVLSTEPLVRNSTSPSSSSRLWAVWAGAPGAALAALDNAAGLRLGGGRGLPFITHCSPQEQAPPPPSPHPSPSPGRPRKFYNHQASPITS